MLYYNPNAFSLILMFVAFVGAFYLLWGFGARALNGLMGTSFGRAADFWTGITFMTLVVILFRQEKLAVNMVMLIISSVYSMIGRIAYLINTLV